MLSNTEIYAFAEEMQKIAGGVVKRYGRMLSSMSKSDDVGLSMAAIGARNRLIKNMKRRGLMPEHKLTLSERAGKLLGKKPDSSVADSAAAVSRATAHASPKVQKGIGAFHKKLDQ